MSTTITLSIFVIFIIINIVIASINNKLRLKAIAENKTDAIKHGWWALGYGILCALPFLFTHSWLQFISLGMLHLSIFPVSYNLFAKLPTFNLSKTSSSLIDKLQVSLGFQNSEFINALSLILSVVLLTIQLKLFSFLRNGTENFITWW